MLFNVKNRPRKILKIAQDHVTFISLPIGGFPWGEKLRGSMRNNKTKTSSVSSVSIKRMKVKGQALMSCSITTSLML